VSGGMMGGPNDRVTQHFFKGNKMKMDSGDTATILDSDAQTFTHVDNKQKTYSVTSFNELGTRTGEVLNKSGAEVTSCQGNGAAEGHQRLQRA